MVVSSRDTSYEYYTFKGDQNKLLEYAQSQEGVLARFWEINTLFHLARNPEAIEKLEEYEHLFVDEWQSHLFFLKEMFLNIEGLETEKTAKKHNQKFILATYYWWKYAKIVPKDRKLGLEYLEKSYEIGKEIGNIGLRVLYYMDMASDMLHHEGKTDEALQLIKKAEKIALEHNQDFVHLHVLNSYGIHYMYLKEYDTALTYFEREYKIAHERKYPFQIGNATDGMMSIYSLKGTFDKSLEFALEGLELEKKGLFKQREAYQMNNIAFLYAKQGDLDKALSYFKGALRIFEKYDYKSSIAVVLRNIGNILKMRDEFEMALNHFERAYELWQEVGNPLQVYFGLSALITLLSSRDRERARIYLDKFEKIEEENRDKINNITSDLKNARAIYLKNSPRLRDKMQSQELFEQLFKENKDLGLSNIEILPHLIELLLLEYGTSKEEHILVELRGHLKAFHEEAKKNNMYPALIKSYLIRSQLRVVEGKFKESEALLIRAVGLAKEKNLITLLKELNEVRSDLTAEVERMQVLLQSNSDLATRLKKSKILEYIKKAQESVVTGSN